MPRVSRSYARRSVPYNSRNVADNPGYFRAPTGGRAPSVSDGGYAARSLLARNDAKVSRDWSRLAQEGMDSVEDLSSIGNTVIGMAAFATDPTVSPDAEEGERQSAAQQASYYLNAYESWLRPWYESNVLSKYDPDKDEAAPITYDELVKSLPQPKDEASGWQKVIGHLFHGEQAGVNVLAGLRQGDLKYAASSLAQGAAKLATPGIQADWLGEEDDWATRWRTDRGGNLVGPGHDPLQPGTQDFMDALGVDAGGWTGLAAMGRGAANVVGGAAVDPLSYLTFGSKAASKPALQALTRVGADDLAKAIRTGTKADDLAEVRRVLVREADKAQDHIERVAGKAAAKGFDAEDFVTRNLESLSGGQQTVRFAGKPILPASMSGRVARSTDNLVERARRSDFGHKVMRHFDTTADMRKHGGAAAARQQRVSAANAAATAAHMKNQFYVRYPRHIHELVDQKVVKSYDEASEGLETYARFRATDHASDELREAVARLPKEIIELGDNMAAHAGRVHELGGPGVTKMVRRDAAEALGKFGKTDAGQRYLRALETFWSPDEAHRVGRTTTGWWDDVPVPSGARGPMADMVEQGATAGGRTVSDRATAPVYQRARKGPGRDISRFDTAARSKQMYDDFDWTESLDADIGTPERAALGDWEYGTKRGQRTVQGEEGWYDSHLDEADYQAYRNQREFDRWSKTTGAQADEQLNAHLRNQGVDVDNLPPELENGLFEHDIPTAAAASEELYLRELEIQEMVQDFAEAGLTDEQGRQLMVRAGSPEAKANPGYYNDTMTGRRVDPKSHVRTDPTEWVMNKDIREAISRAQKFVMDDEAVAGWKRAIQDWNTTWAGVATVLPTTTVGFHGRNAYGNMWNMALAGANPNAMVDGGKLWQKVYRESGDSVIGRMKSAGRSFSDVVDDFVNEGKLTAEEAVDIRMIDDMLSPGGMSYHAVRTRTMKKGPQALGGRRNPVEAGGVLGQFVEDSARIGLYLDGIHKKGLSPTAARDRVYTYLFDYQDLTPFEHGVKNYANRFYTFTRKNVPLQLRTMATTPGKTLNAIRVQDAFADLIGIMLGGGTMDKGEPGEETYLSAWERTLNERAMAYWNNKFAIGFDTPASQAFNAVSAAVGLTSIIPPVSWVYEQLGMMEKGQEVDHFAAAKDALTSGPLISLADAVFEMSVGIDSFTGREIKDESWLDKTMRLTDVIAPLSSDVRDVLSMAPEDLRRAIYRADEDDYVPKGVWDDYGDDHKTGIALELMNRIAGLQVVYHDRDYDGQSGLGKNLSLNANRLLRDSLEGKHKAFNDAALEEAGYRQVANNFETALIYLAMAGGEEELQQAYDVYMRSSADIRSNFEWESGIPLEEWFEHLTGAAYVDKKDADAEEASLEANRIDDAAIYEMQKRSIEKRQGHPLTPEQELRIMGNILDWSSSEAEAAGVTGGPDFGSNRWNNRDEQTSEEEAQARYDAIAAEKLARMSAMSGMSEDQLRAAYPYKGWLEYQISQAYHTTGRRVTQDELGEFLWDEMNKEVKYNLFGPAALDIKGEAEHLTEKELEEHSSRVGKQVTEMSVALYGLGYDADAVMSDIWRIALGQEMTVWEEEGAFGGRLNPKMPTNPSREEGMANIDGNRILDRVIQDHPDVLSFLG